jgi:hypothetical protein
MMTEIEMYAQQMVNAREAEYRSPEFRHRVALLTSFRNLLKRSPKGRA